MAETSFPFEDTDVSESQFAAWAAALAGNGVVSGLAVSPGSGMQVSVAAGTALVRGVYYENTSAKAITVGAAPAAGNTRIDLVVLHLRMATNTVVAEVKAGTANTSGGVAPSLVQTSTEWEHPIARITVASGAASVTTGMLQALLSDPGRHVYTWAETAQRPTPSEATALGLNRADGTWWLWNGTTWTQFGHRPQWADIQGKPATFPPVTPINANTLNGITVTHGTSLPGSGNNGDVFLLHS